MKLEKNSRLLGMSVHQTDAGKIVRGNEEVLEETEVVQREVVIEDYLAHASFQRRLWMIGPIQRRVSKITLTITQNFAI